MTYLKVFRERIQNNDYPGFLKIWEEYCFGDQPDGEEMIAILESVKRADLAKSFGLHVERLLPLWGELKDSRLALDSLRLIFDLQTTQSESLSQLAIETLQNLYPNDPLFQEKLRIVGLRNREKFQGAIRNFELLSHLQKGNFVFHTAGWGTGQVQDTSYLREEASFEFDSVAGIQHISFDKAFRTLMPIPIDHFYARRFHDPDALETEAREHPAEVIRLLLRDLGPKTASEIKDELYETVIPPEDWNRWWQSARAKLKKDTKIESPKELKEPFILRTTEVAHETAFYKAFDNQPTVEAAIQTSYAFLRDFPETIKNSDFRTSLTNRLTTLLAEKQSSDAQKLQLMLLIEDLGGHSEEIAHHVQDIQNLVEILTHIQIAPLQKRILQVARSVRKTWTALYLDALFVLDQNLIRDFLLAELNTSSTKESLTTKLGDLLIHSISYPDIFFWYFQKIIAPKSTLPFSDAEGKKRFFEALLILLDNIEQKPQHRDLAKKIGQLITAQRYQLVRDILKETSIAEAKEFLLLATKCETLTDHDVKIFHSLSEVVHPSLAKKTTDPEDDQTLWTTLEGYQKIQQRMQQIASVETVHNAREIEAARALGDLRENAEFKAALERRDRLQSELKLLAEQMNRAQVLTPADVSTDRVGVGSVVHCQDQKGEQLRFILLGPWDADPEKRILSFQSKLAQAMRGRACGETFEFQGEKFTVKEIDNFFDLKGI